MFEYEKYKKIINIAFYAVLAFLLFNFNLDGNESYIICEILYIGYLLFILQIFRSNYFKYIFEPPIFFLLFTFNYEFLKFPYYFGYTTVPKLVSASMLITPRFHINDYYGNSAMMLVYQFICIVVLLVFYKGQHIRYIKKNFPEVIISNQSILVLLSMFFLLVSAVGLYSITGGDILFLLTRRAGNQDAAQLLQSNYIVSFSSTFVMMAVPILIGIKSYTNANWKKLFIIYIPAIILGYIISGGRGFIIYSLTSMFIILSVKKTFSLSVSKILLVGMGAMFLFSTLGLIRRSFSDTSNVLESIKDKSENSNDSWYYEITGYQLQFRDEMVFANAHHAGFLGGATYLNLVTFPFPRSILGDFKPQFVDSYVGTTFWSRSDVGLPLNAMIESYFNFGYFGIFVFTLLGIVMAKITNFILTNSSIFNIYVAMIAIFYAQTWSTTYLVYVLQFIIIIYFPAKFIKQKTILPQQLKYSE